MKRNDRKLTLADIVKTTTYADRILFVFLFFCALSGLFFVSEMFPPGQSVAVRLDGKTEYSLSLGEDSVVSVTGPIGDSVIEIRDGKVRVKDSPCPGKLCIRQGWTDRGMIACLPNRVVVSVDGGEGHIGHSGYDAVTR